MSDIIFKSENSFFSYGVGAVIIHDDHVLMVKNENFPYYYSVGGGVQFGETSEDAVLREVHEETNLNLKINRLAFVHENLFVADFVNSSPFHEIRLFYLMEITDDIRNIKCDSVGNDGGGETLHWLPIDKLSEYHLYPEFYKTELQNLTHGVKHFVTENEVTLRAK